MSDTTFYDFPVKIDDPVNSHGIQLRLLQDQGSRVLDVGCHSGMMGSFIKERYGSTVVGIDYDEGALNVAGTRLDAVYRTDLESADWAAMLLEREAPFDVAIFGDVLEHVRYPEEVLRETKRLLKPGGKVIVSLPNVANLRVRLGLLRGNFRYADSGILDRTHLRFFTMETAHELLDKAGFELEESDVAGYSLPQWLLRMFPGMLGAGFVMRARAR
ncbi:MAG TPA: class I SAM-dependent methyltransferase [Candidatus Kapabacteria bacterium]|nr:class I SAM-dependent methyltransferase [Candidatus Kapabacteria bacterium]